MSYLIKPKKKKEKPCIYAPCVGVVLVKDGGGFAGVSAGGASRVLFRKRGKHRT